MSALSLTGAGASNTHTASPAGSGATAAIRRNHSSSGRFIAADATRMGCGALVRP